MRKSLGDMIFIPRKGFNTSKSLSPVTMQSAFPATANSRNLLSLGSRQQTLNFNNVDLSSLIELILKKVMCMFFCCNAEQHCSLFRF
jgi:hypothetical protein